MTDKPAVYRDDVLALVEDTARHYGGLKDGYSPGFWLTLLNLSNAIRALPTLPGAGDSHEELIAAGDAAVERMKARRPTTPHREEEA